jgi:hypothetical protein
MRLLVGLAGGTRWQRQDHYGCASTNRAGTITSMESISIDPTPHGRELEGEGLQQPSSETQF